MRESETRDVETERCGNGEEGREREKAGVKKGGRKELKEREAAIERWGIKYTYLLLTNSDTTNDLPLRPFQPSLVNDFLATVQRTHRARHS